MAGLTPHEKLWRQNVVHEDAVAGAALLNLHRHLINAVTSPQAFDAWRQNNRPVWRLRTALAVADHNIRTLNRDSGILDPISKR